MNRLFELFVSILDLLIQNARIEGNFDTGILDLRANIVELQGTPKVCFARVFSASYLILLSLFLLLIWRGIINFLADSPC